MDSKHRLSGVIREGDSFEQAIATIQNAIKKAARRGLFQVSDLLLQVFQYRFRARNAVGIIRVVVTLPGSSNHCSTTPFLITAA